MLVEKTSAVLTSGGSVGRFWLANMAEEGKTMQTCEQPEQRVEPRERRRRR